MVETSDSVKAQAPKWKNLGARFVSAVLFVAFCFVPFYFGNIWWTLLVCLLGGRMMWEWVRMSDLNANVLTYGLSIAGLIASIFIFQSIELLWVVGGLIGLAILAILERIRRGGALWAGVGFLYITIPCLFIIALRGDLPGLSSSGYKLLLWIIAVVAAADTGAYFGGSYFKGPKLVPRLSPKKTWSGLIFGIMSGVILGAIVAWSFGWPVMTAALYAIPVVILSVIGDFIESGFKRKLQVKDTGGVLPGHGGLLDRLDSLMMVVVAAGIFLYFKPEYWPV